MTHEFKTPISSIKISADVLLHHPLVEDDKRLTQYAQIIRDQNQRLNDQVERYCHRQDGIFFFFA
ncbi:MAG: hypothetical protein IPN15_18025 [Saprospiraceae bacterium]|nr:hypothetical protein [Candidatus Vicinibacter affinis]